MSTESAHGADEARNRGKRSLCGASCFRGVGLIRSFIARLALLRLRGRGLRRAGDVLAPGRRDLIEHRIEPRWVGGGGRAGVRAGAVGSGAEGTNLGLQLELVEHLEAAVVERLRA